MKELEKKSKLQKRSSKMVSSMDQINAASGNVWAFANLSNYSPFFLLPSPFLITLFLISLSSYSQETISELSHNPALKKFSPNPQRHHQADTISLPFIDDFSGFPGFAYPNQELWMDSNVFINNTYPVNQVTYGVATFDGLNKSGDPYRLFPPNSKGIADYLTSLPINLEGLNASDNVYLSFFYQPQGLGNDPQFEDYLGIEFKMPKDSIWKQVFKIDGKPLDSLFKPVILKIDTQYLGNGFQFRFVNFATLSGNLDHWHIDYVWVDKNRNTSVSLPPDLAFINNNQSMLKNYQSMPWIHFQNNPSAFLDNTREHLNLEILNTIEDTLNTTYAYNVLFENNQPVMFNGNPVGESGLFEPDSGINTVLRNYPTAFSLNDFFPPDSTIKSNYRNFKIFKTVNDNTQIDQYHKNDTVQYVQRFNTYYAYDDGTAEAAYGLTEYGAKLAYKFNIAQEDTLEAISIYFNQVLENLSDNPFRLRVWNRLVPEEIIYESPEDLFPVYTDSAGGFYYYEIKDLQLIVKDSIFIGMMQTSNKSLNIGLDRNNNSASNLFYNISGAWYNTSFTGHSLMLRPHFGDVNTPLSVRAPEKNKNALNIIYPNPTNGKIYFKNYFNSIRIYGLTGHLILQEIGTENSIDLSHLDAGYYFISTIDKDEVNSISRIIIQK